MGVRWLLRWRLPPGQTPSPQDEDTLLRMLESFHCKAIREAPGSKAGYSYEVKCQLLRQETYNASGVKQPPGMRDMWLVQSSEAKQTVYAVHRADRMVIEMGCEGGEVLEKLSYRGRGKSTISFVGRRFSKGDFVLRVASVVQVADTANLLGHVVEVEYPPLLNPEVAAPMGLEFLELMGAFTPRGSDGRPLGSLEMVRPSTHHYPTLPAHWGFQHAAVSYVDTAILLVTLQAKQAAAHQAGTGGGAGGAASAATPSLK